MLMDVMYKTVLEDDEQDSGKTLRYWGALANNFVPAEKISGYTPLIICLD